MSIYDQLNRGSGLTDKAYDFLKSYRLVLYIVLALILLIVNPVMILALVVIAAVWEFVIRKN